MRVGVIDIGSNTARLLVASVDGGGLRRIEERRVHLGLGEAVERRGEIPAGRLRRTAELAGVYAASARILGVSDLDVIVTAPGRQSRNGPALVAALAKATAAPVRVLTSQDEGRYAFAGAAAALGSHRGVLAVCDVGGGSTEIATGTVAAGPRDVWSYDLGSLRLTGRFFDGRSTAAGVAQARAHVRGRLSQGDPARPDAALVAGGTARALRKVAGRTLDRRSLRRAVDDLTGRKPERIAAAHGLDPARARTLLAGAIIVSELQELLAVPLVVSRWGLREGVALALAAVPAAA
jgi:exopolyphosphatase/guanosine-5'-triphosphate,3'-diphosphate pyrophosphatase